jgi:sec-independent protein translocase protein TatB
VRKRNLIGVVALIVIGPKELPAVLRTIGQWTTKIRCMAGEFQSQFQEAMREAEMADLKKQVDEVSHAAKVVSSDFDPLEFKEAPKLEPQPGPKPDVASATTPEPPAAAEAIRTPRSPRRDKAGLHRRLDRCPNPPERAASHDLTAGGLTQAARLTRRVYRCGRQRPPF